MAKPDFNAYTVIKRGDDKDDYWMKIGSAWPHGDGDGYNVVLQAQPLDGKIVLRRYKDDAEEEKKQVAKGKQYKK